MLKSILTLQQLLIMRNVAFGSGEDVPGESTLRFLRKKKKYQLWVTFLKRQISYLSVASLTPNCMLLYFLFYTVQVKPYATLLCVMCIFYFILFRDVVKYNLRCKYGYTSDYDYSFGCSNGNH